MSTLVTQVRFFVGCSLYSLSKPTLCFQSHLWDLLAVFPDLLHRFVQEKLSKENLANFFAALHLLCLLQSLETQIDLSSYSIPFYHIHPLLNFLLLRETIFLLTSFLTFRLDSFTYFCAAGNFKEARLYISPEKSLSEQSLRWFELFISPYE